MAIDPPLLVAASGSPSPDLHCRVRMERVVIGTNVFVAAGFNPGSAAARILERVRDGRFQLVWNRPTRDETEMILRRIPRLHWGQFAELFRREAEYSGLVDPDAFAAVPDRDDRKFA